MHLSISKREMRGWRQAFVAACGLFALTLSAQIANGDQYCDAGNTCPKSNDCGTGKPGPVYYCCASGSSYPDPVGDVCCQYSCVTITYGGGDCGQCVQSTFLKTHCRSLCGTAGFCRDYKRIGLGVGSNSGYPGDSTILE